MKNNVTLDVFTKNDGVAVKVVGLSHYKGKNLRGKKILVELKKDEVPQVAINQIREKEYVQKFKLENKDKKVLAVAICYDSKNKEHKCIIEEI